MAPDSGWSISELAEYATATAAGCCRPPVLSVARLDLHPFRPACEESGHICARATEFEVATAGRERWRPNIGGRPSRCSYRVRARPERSGIHGVDQSNFRIRTYHSHLGDRKEVCQSLSHTVPNQRMKPT